MKGVNCYPDQTHAATRIIHGKADNMVIRKSRASTAAARLSPQAQTCEASQPTIT